MPERTDFDRFQPPETDPEPEPLFCGLCLRELDDYSPCPYCEEEQRISSLSAQDFLCEIGEAWDSGCTAKIIENGMMRWTLRGGSGEKVAELLHMRGFDPEKVNDYWAIDFRLDVPMCW